MSFRKQALRGTPKSSIKKRTSLVNKEWDANEFKKKSNRSAKRNNPLLNLKQCIASSKHRFPWICSWKLSDLRFRLRITAAPTGRHSNVWRKGGISTPGAEQFGQNVQVMTVSSHNIAYHLYKFTWYIWKNNVYCMYKWRRVDIICKCM